MLLKLCQIVVLMSTSKPPNMKVKLLLNFELELIFDFARDFFLPKKFTVRYLNDLDLN